MNQAEQPEEAVFEVALQLPADQRDAYLDRTCAGDSELRRRVDALLGAFERAGRFLKEPALPGSARTLAASLPPTEKPGDRIGRYKLLEQIGEGGCGVVYVAEQQEPVRRRVALKVIKLGMDTKQVIARFDAERQALALMDHPNIAKVFDAGAIGEDERNADFPVGESTPASRIAGWKTGVTGRPYFVMELVRGIKITDYCDQHQLAPRARLDLFTQVCRAIQHAHQKGVIHRDIKPSNILVTLHDGVPVPKVIDFGIAKATQGRLTDQTVYTAFEQFIGTPAYMSPEQAEMSGLDIDTRSDIYSLGMLLYELLTGNTPFDQKELLAAGLDEMRRTIREKEPPKPSTRLTQELVAADVRRRTAKSKIRNPKSEIESASSPRRLQELIHLLRGDVDWIVMKCLEKDRARRYETANGLAADIQRHLNNEPVVARPPSSVYRFQKLVRRNKLAFTAAVSVAAALVLGLVISTWLLLREKETRRRAVVAEHKAQVVQASESRQRQQAQIEAAKSHQVAQLLQDMLKGVGPSVALGRDTKLLQEILDKTAERVGKDLTNQPEVELELWLTLAATYHDLGLYKQMEGVARQSLQVARSRLGEENESVAACLIDVGDALQHLGSIQDGSLGESEKYTREGLAMSRKLLGPENPKVANALTHLGNVLEAQDRLAEAETTLREALEMSRKLFGKEDPRVAKLLLDIAIVLSPQASRLAEAETMSREALAAQRRLLGDDHPEVAKTLSVLAFALFSQGKSAEAETKFREALAMWRKLQANDRIEVAEELGSLALVLRAQGNVTEAETTARDALAMWRRLSGDENENVASSLSTLGLVLLAQGKLAEAETAFRDAFTLQRKLRGNEDAVVAGSLCGLVEVLLRERKFDEVEPLFNDLLTPAFQTQPKSAGFLGVLGEFRARMGHWKEAATDFSRLVDFEPKNSRAYHALASLLVQRNDLPGYRLHCAQEFARFAGTTDPYTAEEMAKDCLILPDSGVDLSAVGAWADTALTASKDSAYSPWFQLAKGLAEYRQGHFVGAADWTQKVLSHAGDIPERDVEAYMVLAMAQHRSKQAAEASTALAKGIEIADKKLPKLDSGDLGNWWLDWVIAHALMREAKALIEGKSATATEKKSEPR